MKLLLDENLSRRLVPVLQQAYPQTSHVVLLGLERAGDREIWHHARACDFVIVTKDEDFVGLLGVLGFPPRLIRILSGNASNDRVAKALLDARERIEASFSAGQVGLIELY